MSKGNYILAAALLAVLTVGAHAAETRIYYLGNSPTDKLKYDAFVRLADDPVINTDWVPTLLDLVGQPARAGLDGLSVAPLLTSRGSIPARNFWHFPHYTNQGGRPSGAVREGNWMMVEYFEEEKTELYDLCKDIGESQDLAESQPDRVTQMRAALAAWRKEVHAQGNTPNPDFDPAKYCPSPFVGLTAQW